MPLVNWDSKAVYDQMYDIGAEGAWGRPGDRSEVRLHYNRFVLYPESQRRAGRLMEVLGWNATSRVAILGAGYGWTAEALRERGMTSVLAVDTSPYIQGSKDTTEDAELLQAIAAVGLSTSSGNGLTLFNAFRQGGGPRAKGVVRNDDINTNAGRQAIRSAIGGRNNFTDFEVLSEDLISSFTNVEVQTFSARAHEMIAANRRVIHLTGEYQAPFNTNTIAQWKALLPADVFVNISTYVVT